MKNKRGTREKTRRNTINEITIQTSRNLLKSRTRQMLKLCFASYDDNTARAAAVFGHSPALNGYNYYYCRVFKTESYSFKNILLFEHFVIHANTIWTGEGGEGL